MIIRFSDGMDSGPAHLVWTEGVVHDPAAGNGTGHDDGDVGTRGPRSEGRVAGAAKDDGVLEAGRDLLEVLGDVLHALVPGVGAVELRAAPRRRAHHVPGEVASQLVRLALERLDALFPLLHRLLLLDLLLERRRDVHAPDVLSVKVFAVEDGPVGQRRRRGTAAREELRAAGVGVRDLGAGTLAAEPVVKQEVLRGNMSFPLVLGRKRRLAPCEAKDTGERARVLLLDMVLQPGGVFEAGVGAFRAREACSSCLVDWIARLELDLLGLRWLRCARSLLATDTAVLARHYARVV